MRGSLEPLTTLNGNNVKGNEGYPQETLVGASGMLYEFADITDPEELPRRLSHLKWHITGFIDGDGSFPVVLSPDPGKRFGWLIQPRLQVEMAKSRDAWVMLRVICRTLMISPRIYEGDDYLKLVITNRRILTEKVIPFFMKYRPALKWDEFRLMKYVCEALNEKKHLEYEGFRDIIRKVFELPADGETGRKWAFREILPQEEPPQTKPRGALTFPRGIVALKHYIAGFIDAEGCFGYEVNRETKSITPYLTITHSEVEILRKIREIIRCGEIIGGRLQIYGLENTTSRVIPFIDRQKLIAKKTTYEKFKQILEMVKKGKHKTNFQQVIELVKSLNQPTRGSPRDHTPGTPVERG